MSRQEILLNLTILTVIGALVFSIFDSRSKTSGVSTPYEFSEHATKETETTFDPALAKARYPKFGETNPFVPIIPTPTPTPTPTPAPTKTPDINAALNAWKLESVNSGEIDVFNKAEKDPEKAHWSMRVGDTHAADIGGAQKTVTLIKVDESTNPDNPSATFSMSDTDDKKVLKMLDEGSSTPPAPGAPK